jgi:hypothetical protein
MRTSVRRSAGQRGDDYEGGEENAIIVELSNEEIAIHLRCLGSPLGTPTTFLRIDMS